MAPELEREEERQMPDVDVTWVAVGFIGGVLVSAAACVWWLSRITLWR